MHSRDKFALAFTKYKNVSKGNVGILTPETAVTVGV